MIDIRTVRIMLMKLTANTVMIWTEVFSSINDFVLGHQHEPLSFRAKILLFLVLLTIISFALSSILICYFCCGVTNSHNRPSLAHKDRKSSIDRSFHCREIISFNVFFFRRTCRYGRDRCCISYSTLISMRKSKQSFSSGRYNQSFILFFSNIV